MLTSFSAPSIRDCDLVNSVYNWLATVLNVLLRFVPTKLNAEMAATAISAAIRAYSIAVTPDWSLMRFEKNVRNDPTLLDVWNTRLN